MLALAEALEFFIFHYSPCMLTALFCTHISYPFTLHYLYKKERRQHTKLI